MFAFSSKKILLICLSLLLLVIPATVLLVSGMKFAVPKTSPALLATSLDDSILTIQPSPVKTVFVIVMENQDWKAIVGSPTAKYIKNSILPNASYTTQYYNPPGMHPSETDYLWMEAGTNLGIKDNNNPKHNHQTTTSHLTTLLSQSGISWKSYQEDIDGKTCPLEDSGLYAPKHNPMVFFDDITDNNNPDSVTCNLHIRPFEELLTDLSDNSVSQYNFITPNLCDDMHNADGCDTPDQIKNGDTWLAKTVPQITNSPAFKDGGALFITWDEGGGKPDGTDSDGPIGMMVLSTLAKGGGYSNSIHYTHSSFLKTMQEIFNVKPLLGDAVNASDLGDLFISASATSAPKKVAIVNTANRSATKTPTPTSKIITRTVTNTPTALPTQKPTATMTPRLTSTPTPTAIQQVVTSTWQIYPSGKQIADTAFSFSYATYWQIIYQNTTNNLYTFIFYPAGSLLAGQNAINAPSNLEHETLSVKVYAQATDMKAFITANFSQYRNILQYSEFGQMGNKIMYQLNLPSSNPDTKTFGTHGIVLGSKHAYDIGFTNVMSKDIIDQIGTEIWPNFLFK